MLVDLAEGAMRFGNVTTGIRVEQARTVEEGELAVLEIVSKTKAIRLRYFSAIALKRVAAFLLSLSHEE